MNRESRVHAVQMNLNIKERFDEFFNERTKQKQHLYTKIATIGLCFVGCGAIFGAIGLYMWWLLMRPKFIFYSGMVITIIGSVFFSTGVSLVSTIPTDEFDIDASLKNNIFAENCVEKIFGSFSIIFGYFFMAMVPYIFGFLLIVIGLVCCLFNGKFYGINKVIPNMKETIPFTSYLYFVGILILGTIGILFIFLGGCPNFLVSSALYNRDSLRKSIEDMDENYHIRKPLYICCGVWLILMMVYSLMRCLKLQESKQVGWRTKCVYVVWHTWMIGGVLVLITINIIGFFYPGIVEESNSVANIILGIVDLIPVIVVFIAGEKKVFNLMAVIFDNSIERLLLDGAVLAELASQSLVTDENNIWWLYRKEETKFLSETGDIQRRYWLRGKLISGDNRNNSLFEVSMLQDLNLNWSASLHGDQILFSEKGPLIENNAPNIVFEEWISKNFSQNEIYSKDPKRKTVIVKSDIVSCNRSSDYLLETALSNIRYFKFENFTNDLLIKSPRFLTTDVEKLKTFALSHSPKIIKKRKYVDYFVSHSWSDNALAKCYVLRTFVTDIKLKNGTYPTLWLDKVCINQFNPVDSLVVLPITIAMSKKILVLMSDTYMKRLWCIWELFTVITFSRKELAMERIIIKYVGSYNENRNIKKEENKMIISLIEDFDFNNAHCFDPNEEIKLRKIMIAIGVDRLISCFNSVVALLKQDKLSE